MNRSAELQERAYRYSGDIIKLVKENGSNYVDVVLGKQLVRAATSIGANIVEAQSSLSTKGFTNSYRIAMKSANETVYWLRLLQDSNDVGIKEVTSLVSEGEQFAKILASIIIKLRNK